VWCVACSRMKRVVCGVILLKFVRKRHYPKLRGKTGRFNPKQSHKAHVGWNPSNLMAKLMLWLTLQVFETS
jgi:hypothetical protein